MSVFYPRTITVSRVQAQGGFGATGYHGIRDSLLKTIAEKIPAAIQLRGGAGRPDAQLPGDAARKTMWLLLIPKSALPLGTIRVRDIIQDELGRRYQVQADYSTPFGHNLHIERLET